MNIFEQLVEKIKSDPSYQPTSDAEKAMFEDAKQEAIKAVKKESDDLVANMGAEVAKAVVSALEETGVKASEKAKATKPEGDVNKKVDATFKDLESADKVNKFIENTKSERMTKSEIRELADANFNKDEKIHAFFKALISKDEDDRAIVKALSEGTDVDGGHLVPEEFRMDLIKDLNISQESLRQYASVFPMKYKTLELPKLTATPEVYWGTENTAISTTSADFGNLVLTAYRMNAIIYTSRELADDSSPEVVSLLTGLFRDVVTQEENKQFMTGTGTGKPKGIDAETLTTVNASNALSWTHINSAFYSLPKAYRARAIWIMNSRTLAGVSNIKDSNNRPILRDPTSESTLPTLKGRPVIEQNDIASSKIFFGDMKMYYIGDRQQLAVEVTKEAGDTWKKHQLGIKVTERIDGKLALTQSFREISNTGIS